MKSLFSGLILSLIISLSSQECFNKKISISVDVLEETLLSPTDENADELLWHVAIFIQEESSLEFLCSGTVVGDRLVLTAASCVANTLPSELRVVAGLTILRNPSLAVENPHSVFMVTKKYYPYHSDGLFRDDLAILKLDNPVSYKACQLKTLEKTDKLSKHCFTLGWGVHNHSDKLSRTCTNPSFQESMNSLLHHTEQNKPILNNLLDIRNLMGLSSTFILQLIKMLDVMPGLAHHEPSPSNHPQDLTCSMDEYSRIRSVRISTKQPYKCLCYNMSQLCLYSTGVDDLPHRVDIGSPVFCRVKKPKSRNGCLYQGSSQFVLAGIVINKQPTQVPLLKYNTSINMIKALNVTHFSDFIFAVLQDTN